MWRLIKWCSFVILIQGLFAICFQVALDTILHIPYITDLVCFVNGIISIGTAIIGFCNGESRNFNVVCSYVGMLMLIVILHIGFCMSNMASVLDPKGLKRRVAVVLKLYHLEGEHDRGNDRESMRIVEERFKCCGVDGSKDYGNDIPDSCFTPENLVHKDGCVEQVYLVLFIIEIVYSVLMLLFTIAPIIAARYELPKLTNIVNRNVVDRGPGSNMRNVDKETIDGNPVRGMVHMDHHREMPIGVCGHTLTYPSHIEQIKPKSRFGSKIGKLKNDRWYI